MELCIILPGKIGDIIICAPIAKYYNDRGYIIHWPVLEQYYNNFKYDHFPYIKFICVKTIECAYKYADNTDGEILDLSYNNIKSNYMLQNKFSFDEYRYHLAGVDFDCKWMFKINRNMARELKLFNTLNIKRGYYLQHLRSGSHKLELQIETQLQQVTLTSLTDCIFDWIHTIQSASCLFFIESCFSNLTDQMSINRPVQQLFPKPCLDKTLLRTGRKRSLPVLRSKWYNNE